MGGTAATWSFNLDHICTQIRELARTESRRQRLFQGNNVNPVQWEERIVVHDPIWGCAASDICGMICECVFRRSYKSNDAGAHSETGRLRKVLGSLCSESNTAVSFSCRFKRL
jgi:hypothetical protein